MHIAASVKEGSELPNADAASRMLQAISNRSFPKPAIQLETNGFFCGYGDIPRSTADVGVPRGEVATPFYYQELLLGFIYKVS